ncbi:MAG TPA: hypothetical protein VF981_00210, partial [Gemmatimonadaceae bacterium]
MRASRLLPTLALFVALDAAAQSKPAITPADYGRWESLGQASLSPNGRWMAYALNRVSEDNELRVRPMDRDTAFVVPNGAGAVFGAGSRWVAYRIGVSPATRERLEQEKKPVRTALGLRELATSRMDSIADVATFQFSADGRFIALRRYPAEGKRVAEVIVQNLANGARMTFGSVGEFSWADRRPILALTIETDGGAGNAVQVYDAASQVVRVLDSSPSRYRGLAWREKAEDLAVLRTLVDSGFRDTAHVVLAWSGAMAARAARRELDPVRAPGFPSGQRVSESRTPDWSGDGSMLFIGLRPREAATASGGGGREG